MSSSLISGAWADLLFIVGLTMICLGGHRSRVGLAAEAPSDSLRRFASVLSAELTPELGGPGSTFYPVIVDYFQPNFTYYYEYSREGGELERVIVVLGEDTDGVIFVKFYVIPAPSDVPFDFSRIQNLTLNDMEYANGCDATQYEISDGAFLGKWPDCTYFEPEDGVFNPSVLTCNVGAYLIPSGIPTTTDKPYLSRPTKRFELLCGEQNFCQNFT